MTAFRYRVVVVWNDEDEVYVARVPAISGCMARGPSPASAVRECVEAAESILEVMRETGERLPAEDVPSRKK